MAFTREYYTAESQRLADEQQKDPQAFFRFVQTRIQEEEERSKAVLPVGSWSSLRQTTEEALWGGRLEWLVTESMWFLPILKATVADALPSAVGPYMTARDFQSLEAMYTLFGRVDGLKTLCTAFRNFIRVRCSHFAIHMRQEANLFERAHQVKGRGDSQGYHSG